MVEAQFPHYSLYKADQTNLKLLLNLTIHELLIQKFPGVYLY